MNVTDLKIFLKEANVGFLGFETILDELFNSYSYRLGFVRKIQITPEMMSSPKTFCETILDSVYRDIQNSDIVQDLVKPIQDEVIKLKADLEDAKTKIAELKKYQDYYELEYNLRNGKSNET